MATYSYKIPLFVVMPDEDMEPVKIEPYMASRVADDFNNAELLESSRDVRIASMIAKPAPDSQSLIVGVATAGRKSKAEQEAIRRFLSGQCSDGWGENGVEFGRSFTIHVWDSKHDVESL